MYIGDEITNCVVHRVQFRAVADNKLGVSFNLEHALLWVPCHRGL